MFELDFCLRRASNAVYDITVTKTRLPRFRSPEKKHFFATCNIFITISSYDIRESTVAYHLKTW